MDIHKLTRKLRAARREAKKQTAIADDLSREIVQRMRQYLKDSHTTLPMLSKRSGIPYTQIVNWLSGNMDYCVPHDKVKTLWDAITPVKGQKPSFSHQLRSLPDSEWAKDNRTLAEAIGCSVEHVNTIRRSLKAQREVISKWSEFLKVQ